MTNAMMWGLLYMCTAVLIFVLALPPCEYEDSRNCIWRADQQGNGIGQSFIDIGGYVLHIR